MKEKKDKSSKKKDSNSSEANLHPISCHRCRQLHKKCNRKLPTCSKCASAGVECNYNAPLKRGKASETYLKRMNKTTTTEGDSNNNNIGSSNATSSHATASSSSGNAIIEERALEIIPNSSSSLSLSPNRVVDLYFVFLCGVNPLIEKDKLLYFTDHCLSQCVAGERIQLEDNEWIKSVDEVRGINCFYWAISAHAKQVTEGLDEVSLRKAEREFSIASMDYSKEFYWAASAFVLYMVYIGEGDLYKQNYYLSIVNFYLENNRGTIQHKFYAPFERFRDQIASRFKNNQQTLENTLESLYKIFYHSTKTKLDEFLLPGVWEHMTSSPVTPQNFVLFKQVFNIIFEAMARFKHKLTSALVDCQNEVYLQSQRLYTTILTEGQTFLFMKQIQDFSFIAMEEIALKITLLTENELFLYPLLVVISPIVEVSSFHLGVCKQIERGRKQRKSTIKTSAGQVLVFDYFNILEKDLRAMEILNKRYKRISMFYGDMINEMADVINRNKTGTQSYQETIFEVPNYPQFDEILSRQLEEFGNDDFDWSLT